MTPREALDLLARSIHPSLRILVKVHGDGEAYRLAVYENDTYTGLSFVAPSYGEAVDMAREGLTKLKGVPQ